MSAALETLVGNAILGIDTLWGGDVMCASGTGRFIADSWFSDEPLPLAYTRPDAAPRSRIGRRFRQNTRRRGHRRATSPQVDIPGAIEGLKRAGAEYGGLRGEYLAGLALCFEAMWDLAMEILGRGAPVPIRTMRAGLDRPAAGTVGSRRKSASAWRSCSVASGDLLAAVDGWRARHRVPMASIRLLGAAVIGHFDQLAAAQCRPLPAARIRPVPRANIEFLPIQDAWFSGSMNYLGRARRADGGPEYEATYEINASLEISLPEFLQLVSHEVVPGHVTTFAYLQDLYVRGEVGLRSYRADDEYARRRAVRGHRQQRHSDGVRRHRGGPVTRPGSADRRAAGPAAGRCQESIVVT